MNRYSMFSSRYLDTRNSRGPQLTIGQVAGSLALSSDNRSRPLIPGRTPGRIWWESGWQHLRR